MKSKFSQNFYTPIFILALILAIIGLVNLFAVTSSFEQDWKIHFKSFFSLSGVFKNTDLPDLSFSRYFANQVLYHVLGIVIMFMVLRFNVKALYQLAPVAYVTSLALLVLVLLIGSKAKGSLSWLDLGGVRIQPSEFAKLALILYFSRYMASLENREPLGLGGLVKPLLIAGAPMLLVILQKDLGSSLFFGLIFLTLVLIQGIRWHLIVVGLVVGLSLAVVSYNYLLMPYQQKRIVSFMNPELDPRGAGYHLVQSKIAAGSGQMWGRGWMKGESYKLKYLPEPHTDFIFPVLAEEWGFAGAVSTLALYSLFLLYGVNVASRSDNRFGFFLGIGMVSLFFWHLVINLGGVLGLLPLTGVPLPLLSYGGSSLLTTWIAVGVLLSLYRSRLSYGLG